MHLDSHLATRLDRLESAVARARHRADVHDMADAMARRASVAVWYRNKKRTWDRITHRRQQLLDALRSERRAA